jgi:hypothetical protein
MSERFHFRRDLGNPVRAARMFRGSHGHFRAPIERGFGDPEIVSGDDEAVEFLRTAATIPNVTEQRLARDFVKRLSWKSRRAPSCGNNADCLTHFVPE